MVVDTVVKEYIITYLHPDKEAEGNLCVEWIDGRWCRTTRDILGDRVEASQGLGNDRQAYDALLDYFKVSRLKKLPIQQGFELMSPSQLEALVKSGI